MYRNSKHTVIFPLILSAGVVLGILLGQYLGRHDTASQIRGMLSHMSVPSNKLTYTLSLIENRYVDSVSMDSLAEHVIPLLVRELDPHSVYIPASEMAALNEPLEGEFDGIGVVFNMATDTVIVLNVIPHGPSDKAGVKAGDRIVEIGDSLVAGRKIPQNEVVKMLRGPRGSKVRLGLGRQGIDGLVEVEVERGIIPIRSVESAFRIVDGIGYVKLGQFARTTAGEFRAALDTLRAQGVSKLIFDLRGNSGGFLDQAIAVANEFLHEGQLIVYTEDRRHEQLREYADGTGSAQEMEVAVLIDEASASSSEILAGALQDNDRGTIVGRRSFGKGLVQQQIPYADGSALRLTTARYYTAFDPETLHDRRRRELRGGSLEPLPEQRVLLGGQHPLRRFAQAHDTRREGGLWRGRHHARRLRAGRHDRRDEVFYRGGGTQYPLPLYDRICRPASRRAERRADDRRAGFAARRRPEAFRRFHRLCGPQGRRAALRRYRPLAQTHRGATEGLHRAQHVARGRRILCANLPRGRRDRAGHRDSERKAG